MRHLKPFNITFQIHLLRHFQQVSNECLAELSHYSGKDEQTLRQQTLLPASKLFKEFAVSPRQLYNRLQQTNDEDWKIVEKSAEKTDYIVTFSEKDWPNGIGCDVIIRATELSKHQLNQVSLQRRDEWLVKTLVTAWLPKTRQLVIVMSRDGTFLTIFPGAWLPPLNQQISMDYIFLIPETT